MLLKDKVKEKAYKKAWYIKNKKRIITQQKAYRQRPEVKAKARAWGKAYRARSEVVVRRKPYQKAYGKAYQQRPEVREKKKVYYARPEVREKKKAWEKVYYAKPLTKKRAKIYYIVNRIKIVIRVAAWQQANPEKRNKAAWVWRQSHPEQLKATRHNRRVAGGEILTVAKIKKLYVENIKRYGALTCYLCCKPIIEGKDSIDHKLPVHRGGTNNYKNLGIAHRFCNRSKNKKTEAEYRTHKGLLL